MSNAITLDVASREVTGKKVKHLRRAGMIPGVVYGPLQKEPVAVQIEWTVLRPILNQAGGTSLIDLNIDGKKVSVLVRAVHRHPVRRDVLNIDFYAVDVNVTIKATIPIVIPDTEEAGKRLAAKLFQPLNRIEVECLPADLPSQILVDMSILNEAGEKLTVADLPPIKGVTFLADDNVAVVRTVSLAVIAAAAEAADLAEAAELAATEGEDVGVIDELADADDVEVIARGKEEEEEF